MTDGLTAVDPRRPRAEGGAWLNLGCGTHTAPAPWWNVDVVRDGDTQPDEVVPRGTLPYLVDSCARVMLSHLMEHVPWGQHLLDVLTDCRRLLAPGGTLLAIGPDAKRTATLWKQGQLHDELRLLFRRRAEREDHLGQALGRDAEVHRRVRRHHRRTADLRLRSRLVSRPWSEDGRAKAHPYPTSTVPSDFRGPNGNCSATA